MRASTTVYYIGKSLLICNIVLHVARLGFADMRWHRDKRVETNDVLRHQADAEGWKHFDSEYPDFSSDPRNVSSLSYMQPCCGRLMTSWRMVTYQGGVQSGIKHVLYAWMIDRPSGYEVEYLSWDINAIFYRTTGGVDLGYTMER
ncbi:uncharacterized protein E5676_scaffold105G001620 [Cucumis melo var. makuwa]|uniref:Uncharacterized protein n=1 Tax=Cucumis melo var. makuwa TaxID=1194695 RepID=A0A5D3CBN7_CUCMM|nr:uncharacterized protein E5676_scaffold105G001620 [Cucumis melo var. makuwa]